MLPIVFLSRNATRTKIVWIELMLEAKQRNSARGVLNSEDKNEYLCFGLYAFGNHYGVTNRTHDLSKAVKYLNNFLLQRMPDHRWTSLVISNNNLLPMHKDNHNVGWNALYGLGDYSGGGLWQEIESENLANGREVHWREDVSGTLRPGVIHESRGTTVYFPPKVNHATEPWKGNRILITAWTSRGIRVCETKVRRQLRRLHFPCPMGSELQCYTSSCECACVLAEEDEDGMIAIEHNTPEDVKEHLEEILMTVQDEVQEQASALPKVRKYDLDLLCLGGQKPSYLGEWVENNGGKSRTLTAREFDLNSKRGSSFVAQVLATCTSRWLEIELPHLRDEGEGEDADVSGVQIQRRRQRRKKVLKNLVMFAEQHVHGGGELLLRGNASSLAWKDSNVKELCRKLASQGKFCYLQGILPPPDEVPLESKPSRMRMMTTSMRMKQDWEHTCFQGKKKALTQWENVAHTVMNQAEDSLAVDSTLPVESFTTDERKKYQKIVHQLHKRSGHPSNHTLAGMLRARGVHKEVVKMALDLQCSDCQEMRLAEFAPAVSLHQSDTPWKVIQVDNAELKVGNEVIHFMLIADEATHLIVAAYLFTRNNVEGRNATAEEAVRAIEQHWVQMFGLPATLRLDPEGCFRSKFLEEWAAERGVEVLPNPGEAHQQTGLVESLIGKVKKDAVTLMAGDNIDPFRAILNVVAAHNTVHRTKGFSPAQWAFGRDFGSDGRLFDSEHGLPCVQAKLYNDTTFGENLNIREAAATVYRKSQADHQMTRLLNMKTRPSRQFMPGDLVFYRRVKPPSDRPAHPALGAPKINGGRWYGPGRVVATETRSDCFGLERRPMKVVWISSVGRLKRCAPDQLRHASEREAILAEEASEKVTPGWTFHSLLKGLDKGSFEVYDDYVLPEDLEVKVHRRRSETASRELQDNVAFKRARQRHEQQDRPLHVIQQERAEGGDTLPEGQVSAVCDELMVCKFEVKLPERENQWKKFQRDATSWVVNDLRKNEVKYARLSTAEKNQFDVAKMSEINQWIKEKAVKRAMTEIPRDRVMRMRWVLTWKSDPQPDNPEMRKAKARLVVVGFEDPDLTQVPRASPTMTRRTRQLVYVLARLKGWRTMKADVKAAFLQGEGSQQQREIFAMPPSELSDAMNIPQGEAIQLVKAAYGLVNAPAEWYKSVHATLSRLGFQRLRTEPCCWRLIRYAAGKPILLGLVVAHVEDFILAGNENEEQWLQAVRDFHSAYRWSPWECGEYPHCGVQIHEGERETVMSQAEYCAQLQQIEVSNKDEDLPATEEEKSQLRGLLGGIQWLRTNYVVKFITTGTKRSECKTWEYNLRRVCSSGASGLEERQTAESFTLLAAETQACSEAEEELMYIRVQWWEMLGYDIDLRRPELACARVTGVLITDAKSLYDILMKGDLNSAAAGLKEKYSALEALSLIERIQGGKTQVRWVHSDAQVADAMTKPTPSGALHALLTLGRWKLVYDPTFTSAKKRRKEFTFQQ
ncbi:unnamed protein product [Symbiodinium sp. KB8]|nr:unnamed protein product [Symbiodinium sp. KB8]